jgi:anti-sigma-K factor RskA
MTRETAPFGGMTCAEVDELDAAYAVGAVDAGERAAIDVHLAACPEPHADLRSLLGAETVLASSLAPVAPSAALRDRLMESIAATPQEAASARPAAAASPAPAPAMPERATAPASTLPRAREPRRGWFDWLTPAWSRGLAVAAVAVALVFGGWNVVLQGQLSSRDQALRDVANAIAHGSSAFRINATGGGAGYVVADPSGKASMVVADLASPGSGRIYELWLIGADGKPVVAGTFGGSANAVAVVPLERGLSGYTTFAVTVETDRVYAPTSKPVMTAALSG